MMKVQNNTGDKVFLFKGEDMRGNKHTLIVIGNYTFKLDDVILLVFPFIVGLVLFLASLIWGMVVSL